MQRCFCNIFFVLTFLSRHGSISGPSAPVLLFLPSILIEPRRTQGIMPRLSLLSLVITSRKRWGPGPELPVCISEGREETDVIYISAIIAWMFFLAVDGTETD